MALDGIYIYHLVNELNENLKNYRIEAIWQNDATFIFSMYYQGNRKYLQFNLEQNVSSYITDKDIPKGEPTNFLRLLKKHLESAILNNITQYLTDRVIIFEFTNYDYIHGPQIKTLIFEAMGRYANLFLVENEIIVDCYNRSFVLEGRHLVPHAKFEFFKSDKISAKEYDKNSLLAPKEIADKYLGISLRLANYLYENQMDPFSIPLNPTYSKDHNDTYFFNIFGGETTSFKTLSEALNEKVIEITTNKDKYEAFLDNKIKQKDKKYSQLLRQQKKAYENLTYKEKADYIYQSSYDLTQKLSSIDDILLDNQKTLSDNAQHFYNLYKKGKRALVLLEKELSTTLEEKEVFLLLKAELDLASKKELTEFDKILEPYGFNKVNKQKHNQKVKLELLTIKDNDATYIIGKNAYQNAHLINNVGGPNDYWFHVKDGGGSHVLVKDATLTENVIRKAAMLAAHFSSQSLSSSIPVNYTLFKNVKKINGKPASMVKIKNEKTIYIDIIPELIKEYTNV